MTRLASLDLDALLAALVLDPATYSRNRFFDLYVAHDVRRVRRRAMHLRSIVRDVARTGLAAIDGPLAQRRHRTQGTTSEGLTELSYAIPTLALRRTALLDSLELCLVKVALGRISLKTVRPNLRALLPTADDQTRVQSTLARLAPASVSGRSVSLGETAISTDNGDSAANPA